jgi:hypothetical protein
MGVDDAVRALAAKASNSGYLLQHEPALVVHGAGAESYVFSDPNASMLKARQFSEVLIATIFLKFGIPNMPSRQFKRLDNGDDLQAPEVIAQETVDDLQAALSEFAAVAEALQLAKAERGEQ